MLDLDELKEILPHTIGSKLNAKSVLELAKAMGDPENVIAFRDNIIGYRNILDKGKFKADDYFAAVRYMTFKAMRHTDKDAWSYTFPDRLKRLTNEGKLGNLHAHVHAYTQSRIIQLMMQQFSVPKYLIYHDLSHEAIAQLAKEMKTAKTDMARVRAAEVLLTHLTPPVDTKLDVEITVKQTTEFDSIMQDVRRMALNQQQEIAMKQVDAKDVAERKLFREQEVIEHEP